MIPYFQQDGITLYHGDCREVLEALPDESIHCCVTSPPYWGLRDYGTETQIGLERTPEAYVEEMVAVFREVRRVLRDDGTLWLNLGDSYNGSTMTGGNNSINGQGGEDGFKMRRQFNRPKQESNLKPKDLVGIPWRVAFALQADGWWLRQDIIWHKPNPMPESVTDRCTKSHEYVFLLTKSARYFYDAEAVKEQALANAAAESNRNRRSVWTIATKPYTGAHFAVMPEDLVEPCIRAGTSEHGVCAKCGAAVCDCSAEKTKPVVLDPFGGSGTVAAVAQRLGCEAILTELNPEYCELIRSRFTQRVLF